LVNENGTIYFISGITKVPFTSWQAFIGLGYSLRNVTNGSLQNYIPSTTYFISTANTDHPWGSWLLYNGTVYYSTEAGLIGAPSAAVFINNGGIWDYVVKANKYDIVDLNSNRNLPLLATGDSRVYSQPTLAFQPAQNASNQTTATNVTKSSFPKPNWWSKWESGRNYNTHQYRYNTCPKINNQRNSECDF
jgi:hypothetical protein